MRLYCTLIYLLSFLPSLYAEPLNVVVGDLTFVRPESWQWAPPPGNSPANTRFIVRPADNKDIVDIRFYAPGKTPLEAQTHWKTFLAAKDVDSFHVEEKTIGKRTITYVTFQGKIKVPGEPPALNEAFVGAIIPYEDKFMHIRMFGPRDLVVETTAVFKKTLESAVRERESESGGN